MYDKGRVCLIERRACPAEAADEHLEPLVYGRNVFVTLVLHTELLVPCPHAFSDVLCCAFPTSINSRILSMFSHSALQGLCCPCLVVLLIMVPAVVLAVYAFSLVTAVLMPGFLVGQL